MKRFDFLLLCGSIAICLVMGEFFARYYISSPSLNKAAVYSDELIDFYFENSRTVHHLRGLGEVVSSPDFDGSVRRAAYTVTAPYKKGSKNILIQGDSWAEQYRLSKHRSDPSSKNKLEEFAAKYGLGIINAGTSSYAPSTMTMQIKMLREKFNVYPTVILASIEQSDLGDELCRYFPRKIRDQNGKLIAVSPEPFNSTEVYQMEYFFQKQQALRDSSSALLGLIEAVGLKFKYEITKAPRRCGWSVIARPMHEGLNREEIALVRQSINDYLNEVFSDKSVTYLQIVIHPHRQHFLPIKNGGYSFYTGRLIKEIVSRHPMSDKVGILDFKDRFWELYGDRTLDNIFKVGDIASHLTDDAHGSVYVSNILDSIARNAME